MRLPKEKHRRRTVEKFKPLVGEPSPEGLGVQRTITKLFGNPSVFLIAALLFGAWIPFVLFYGGHRDPVHGADVFELFVAITVALMSVAAAGFGYRSARIATRLERFLTPNRPDLERIRDLETESAILIRVLEVFGDSERAIQWMRENNPALKNEPPIRAIQQEDGRREVLNILGRIEHGVIS